MFNSDGTIPVVSSDAIYRNKSAEDSLQGTVSLFKVQLNMTLPFPLL